MKQLTSFLAFLLICNGLTAQQGILFAPNTGRNTENIYTIKKQYLEHVLHNTTDKNAGPEDNDLERFNRWFNFVEPRCYPSGNLPSPDILLRATEKQVNANSKVMKNTSSTPTWHCVGPFNVPDGFLGIGRINVVVVDPLDTNTIYAGAACGGLWISHNYGMTWTSNTDNFPSLSIADIAVNPHHTDTIYAATGDGYGGVEYGEGLDNIFFGGLYSAGVMKSTDGGSTWNTTGLSYLQSNRDIVQRLLIHPNNPNILLAATTYGIYRTADAGVTWTLVNTTHAYSMVFKPGQPDTIYAVNTSDIIVSYDAGLTWNIIYPGINTSGTRCSLAVSPASPSSLWVLNDYLNLYVSNDDGGSFSYLSLSTIYSQGSYDRVLGVSPSDPTNIFTGGVQLEQSSDGGYSWSQVADSVHPDYHAIAFNILNASTFYTGNDGGIWRTTDNGVSWVNLCHNMAISQAYRMSSSRQNPGIMICGLQDNSSFYNDGTGWLISNMPLADGMDCSIHPLNDSVQVASYQGANFYVSVDKGATFNSIMLGSGFGYWTAPVVFNPASPDTIYFGSADIYASYDRGTSAINITGSTPFPYGAVSLAIAPSDHQVLYAADLSHILRTTDGGATWNDVTGIYFSDSLPITRIAVDYNNPTLVYVTVSGYHDGQKVYSSTAGGSSWTNISSGLPNIPANCIAVDSTIPGALYLGNDMGVYYTDSYHTGWTPFGTGLPNVVVDDININYTNYRIKAATYGRGIWETALNHIPTQVNEVSYLENKAALQPNPTKNNWTIVFNGQKPADFTVTLTDVIGNIMQVRSNTEIIETNSLAPGFYNLQIKTVDGLFSLKAIKE